MQISLSILEYEPELLKNIKKIKETSEFSQITNLIDTEKISHVHIDVMRPPTIEDKNAFNIDLVKKIYLFLHKKISLAIHLMVPQPISIIHKINKFILKQKRLKISIIIQIESFSSEADTIKALNKIKKYGYKTGICLDLPTPRNLLTENILNTPDFILLMTVPMGRGGQKYSDKGTERIAYFSQKRKPLVVDGGINPHTILLAKNAGASIAVVGSYISKSKNPIKSLVTLNECIRQNKEIST
jgi:pentose-5-phosphate-3-epimerase